MGKQLKSHPASLKFKVVLESFTTNNLAETARKYGWSLALVPPSNLRSARRYERLRWGRSCMHVHATSIDHHGDHSEQHCVMGYPVDGCCRQPGEERHERADPQTDEPKAHDDGRDHADGHLA
jgi:hypothetical protein